VAADLILGAGEVAGVRGSCQPPGEGHCEQHALEVDEGPEQLLTEGQQAPDEERAVQAAALHQVREEASGAPLQQRVALNKVASEAENQPARAAAHTRKKANGDKQLASVWLHRIPPIGVGHVL
jgi:hypothetical protein